LHKRDTRTTNHVQRAEKKHQGQNEEKSSKQKIRFYLEFISSCPRQFLPLKGNIKLLARLVRENDAKNLCEFFSIAI